MAMLAQAIGGEKENGICAAVKIGACLEAGWAQAISANRPLYMENSTHTLDRYSLLLTLPYPL